MRGPLFDWQRLRVEMPVISYHAPSHGRGMPEGQGVGRRRKRAKPTSGAARHLLPEEGGRKRFSGIAPPFIIAAKPLPPFLIPNFSEP